MELGWGGGHCDVFLDLRTRQLVAYSDAESAAKVHQTYGGENYYQSLSGMSGSGWVPAHMALRPVSTYRVDTVYIEAPRLDEVPEALPGIHIMAPTSGREITREWPIAVLAGGYGENQEISLLDGYGLNCFLSGDADYIFTEKEMVIQYLPSVWGEATERKFKVRVRKDTHLNFRRALIGLFSSELAFDSGEYQEQGNRFWSRLGLKMFDGRLYKVAQNVCRASYSREELSTTESLQAVAPANVLVLAPNLYVQESGTFEAVGLFEIDDQEVEYEEVLGTPDAIKAMTGDFQAIHDRLEAGARQKIEADRRHAAAEAAEATDFRTRCEMHGDVEVTMEDSVAAGNCRPGTIDFRDEHFRGRTSATIRELLPLALRQQEVRRVLEYKLEQIGG